MEFLPYAIIFILYFIATILYVLRWLINTPKISAIALRLTLITSIIHACVLFWNFFYKIPHSEILTPQLYQLSALLVAFAFVILCFSRRFYLAGPFFLTLVVVFMTLAFSQKQHTDLELGGKGQFYLALHMFSIFLSLSVFAVTFICLMMRWLLEFDLKHKMFGSIIFKFPALETLDLIYWKGLNWGFVLLSFVLITGAGYLKMTRGFYLSDSITQWFTIIIWLLMAFIVNIVPRVPFLAKRVLSLSTTALLMMIALFILGLK